MKKILGYPLISLALATISMPVFAGLAGVSIRGDVGALGSQVPYFGVDNIVDSVNYTSTISTFYSDRYKWNWDFTGRLFTYLNCTPCDKFPIYLAASWQGSEYAVNSQRAAHLETPFSHAVIPIRVEGQSGFLQPYGEVNVTSTALTGTGIVGDLLALAPAVTRLIPVYGSVIPSLSVRNEFSKAKLGIGFDFIKTPGFGLTMEVGANYLNAKLTSEKRYDITVGPTPASAIYTINLLGTQILTTTQTGNIIVAPTFSDNLDLAPLANSLPAAATPAPVDFIHRINEKDHTEGVGLYAFMKGEYKFSLGCLGQHYSLYGKAEMADIIGRQRYDYEYVYSDQLATGAARANRLYSYQDMPLRQYNNIVEVDLEAAFVYRPSFSDWDDVDMSLALGVRADSFVNLFSHLTYNNNQSIWNLSRPSLFIEWSVKM